MNKELDGFLLGDNGYSNTPICLTPYLNPENAAQEHYNRVHKNVRCTIERSFGQLKKRFYCLGSILRIKLDRIPSTIVTCFVLHNLAKSMNDPDFPYEPDENIHPPAENGQPLAGNDVYLRRLGEIKRTELVTFLDNRNH